MYHYMAETSVAEGQTVPITRRLPSGITLLTVSS